MALMRSEIWNDDALAPALADRFYALLPTSTPAAPTTGSTIATSTSGNAIPSARLNPAGDITGSILQAGLYDGQRFEVRNISAHSITAAAAGTSNVADGVGSVLAALTIYEFRWDATAALWFRVGGA